MTKPQMVEQGFVSVAKAAEYLGISPQRVYDLIHGGVLTHSQHGGKFVLPMATLKQYAQRNLVLGTGA